jgi:hypothetical protein
MKVRCIDSYYYSCIDINLTNDKIYEVLNVYESKYSKTCYYYIKNDDGVVNYYGKERFEEVKVIKKVLCTNGLGQINLTTTKIYEVIKENRNIYAIIDDYNNIAYYDKQRFREFEKSEEGDKNKMKEYNVGDKVKIKSYEELKKIAKSVDINGVLLCSGIYFIKGMRQYCEETHEIISKNWAYQEDITCYKLKNISYHWTEEMFEKVDEQNNEQTFTKEDLKTGMTVEIKNGTLYKVLRNVETPMLGKQELFFANENANGCLVGSNFSNDLFYNGNNDFTIIKVYDKPRLRDLLSFSTYSLLWERDLKKEVKYRGKIRLDNEIHNCLVTYDGKEFNIECGCFKGTEKEAMIRLADEFSINIMIQTTNKLIEVRESLIKEWNEKYG